MAVLGYSSVILLALLVTFSPPKSQAKSLFPSTRSPIDVIRVLMKDVDSLVEDARRHRGIQIRNQFQDCIRDAVKAEQEWFTYCKKIFENVMESRVVDNSTLEAFCVKNCSGRVWELSRKLVIDCGYIPEPDLVNYDEVLKEACDDDGHGQLCVLDWDNVDYKTIPGYLSCAQASDNTEVCPSDCKMAIPEVIRLYNCCYGAIQRSPNNYIKYIISERKFELCGFKVPPRCTAPSGK